MTNRPTREKYKLNLEIPKSNHVRFETKHLKHLDSKVWNSLPYHIKSSVCTLFAHIPILIGAF